MNDLSDSVKRQLQLSDLVSLLVVMRLSMLDIADSDYDILLPYIRGGLFPESMLCSLRMRVPDIQSLYNWSRRVHVIV